MKKSNKNWKVINEGYVENFKYKPIVLHGGRSSCKKYYAEKYQSYMDNYKDTCLDKFIDLCVEWLTKSDLTYWIYALGSKDTKYLKKWFEARKIAMENKDEN